jgi:peptidoglycan/LPS O-acetylase OafA/YrhL
VRAGCSGSHTVPDGRAPVRKKRYREMNDRNARARTDRLRSDQAVRMVIVPSTAAPALVQHTHSSKHIPALDGLRGVAILAVFFHHYTVNSIHNSSVAANLITAACGLGWSGVDLFFVLSGFLITGILYDTRDDPHYYRTFYARRTLRIFPIYYLFIAIALLALSFGVWHPGHLLFLIYLGYPAALVWPALVNVPLRITHLWSLSAEEQFYMLWPWLMRKLRTPKNVLRLCGFLGIAALLARIAFPSWAYASLPCRIDDLAMGAALAVLVRGNLDEACRKWAPFLLAASATVVVLICAFRHTTDHNDRAISTVGFSALAIAYGSLLLLSLGPLSQLFSIRVLRIFGKYSYGMYLYHFPLSAVLEHVKPVFTNHLGAPFSYVLFCLAANLGVAALSFHFFEQPILRLKKRFVYTREQPIRQVAMVGCQ